MSAESNTDATATPASIVVLWRPGCGFCRMLFSGLERHGIAYETRNIWEDAQARAMLNERIGSETVPSVLLGEAIMVNPSITDLLERLES
jgi:glutaredoxin